jgi:hypothetical protein
MELSDSTRKNLPFAIDAGILILLLTMIWQMGSWKGQIDEQMSQQRAEIQSIRAIPISAQADRRLSVVEAEAVNTQRQLTEMKADLVRRLERIDAKIDRLGP